MDERLKSKEKRTRLSQLNHKRLFHQRHQKTFPEIPNIEKRLLTNHTQQLFLEDILPFLVLLAGFIRLVVLPTDGLLALPARNIAHDVSPGGHAAFDGFGLGDVDDRVEEKRLAMLTSEVLGMYPS